MIGGDIHAIGGDGRREEELNIQEIAELHGLRAERIAEIKVQLAAVKARNDALVATREARELAEKRRSQRFKR